MSAPMAKNFPTAFMTCCLQTRSKRRSHIMVDSVLVQRPEFVREVETSAFGVVQKPLTTYERIFNNAAVRKLIILLMLALLWQSYSSCMNPTAFFWKDGVLFPGQFACEQNPLLFPKFN